MDKTWMRCTDRSSDVYLKGVDNFLQFAFKHSELEGEIPCPCKKCNNVFHKSRDEVKEHLIIFGIVKGYTRWLYHGESAPKKQNVNQEEDGKKQDIPSQKKRKERGDDMFEMIYDAVGPEMTNDFSGDKYNHGNASESTSNFFELLEDAAQQLYPGCETFSKLSLIVELFQIKCLHGLSDKAVDSILKLIKRALPSGETLPESFYGAKKVIRSLGLRYEKIHACENDMLFWKHNAKAESCSVCGESRWQSVEGQKTNGDTQGKIGNKVPRKVLRYFPLKSRLQRLFISSEIASDMTWHYDRRLNDGFLRHPADSEAWKHFDAVNPGFARDPRNVRLGLASDGINPFGNLSVSHSTWPVITTVYNLLPWMCMKQPYCFLSLLIPGPKAPGNDIDVYLEPLIDELQELWFYGVDTYDASRKEIFCMRAALLWTINDVPAYVNLSGWSTKGALACPSCNKDTPSTRLRFLRTLKCYVRNRNQPEGSIAEGYIVEECIILCSRYLPVNANGYNRMYKNYEGDHNKTCNGLSVFVQRGSPLLRDTSRNLEELERKQAHLYVLRNCEEVQPFLREYEQNNTSMNFDDWFSHRILQMRKEKNQLATDGLYSLARGPFDGVQRFKGYEINGFRFHTKLLEKKRKNQNSGILVRGVANGKKINYYGVLTEIIELQYFEGKRVVLFKCDWWDVDHIGKGVKIDKHDFVSVNTKRKLATNEPFVLASQAEQIFYVKDHLHPNWSIVLNGHSTYFTGGAIDEDTFQQDACNDFLHTYEDDEDSMNWERNDLDVISTDVTAVDDIIEGSESEPETDDEDLLL